MSLQTKIFPEEKRSLRQVRKQFDELLLDKNLKRGVRIGFINVGLMLIILAVAWYRLPPEVPLLYSRPVGEAQIVSFWFLWLLPLASLLITGVLVKLASQWQKEDGFLAKILVWGGAFVALMMLVTLVKIVMTVW